MNPVDRKKYKVSLNCKQAALATSMLKINRELCDLRRFFVACRKHFRDLDNSVDITNRKIPKQLKQQVEKALSSLKLASKANNNFILFSDAIDDLNYFVATLEKNLGLGGSKKYLRAAKMIDERSKDLTLVDLVNALPKFLLVDTNVKKWDWHPFGINCKDFTVLRDEFNSSKIIKLNFDKRELMHTLRLFNNKIGVLKTYFNQISYAFNTLHSVLNSENDKFIIEENMKLKDYLLTTPFFRELKTIAQHKDNFKIVIDETFNRLLSEIGNIEKTLRFTDDYYTGMGMGYWLNPEPINGSPYDVYWE